MCFFVYIRSSTISNSAIFILPWFVYIFLSRVFIPGAWEATRDVGVDDPGPGEGPGLALPSAADSPTGEPDGDTWALALSACMETLGSGEPEGDSWLLSR